MLKICLLLGCFVISIQSVTITREEGYGRHFKLGTVQNAWLEGYGNYGRNGINQMIVGHLRYYRLKRSLIQFENLPSSCPAHKIIWARMQLYFQAAHRASFRSVYLQPWVDYTLHVHQVLKSWREPQVTAYRRFHGSNWAAPYLKLGIDAESQPQCDPTKIRSREPRGYKGFDVTGAVRRWAEGDKNYGLLIKVVRENIYGRGLRFWNRYHPNPGYRPYLEVLCKK